MQNYFVCGTFGTYEEKTHKNNIDKSNKICHV